MENENQSLLIKENKNEDENTNQELEQLLDIKENEEIEEDCEVCDTTQDEEQKLLLDKELLKQQKKEERRIRYNAYHREYYKNNKEKFNKHCLPGRKRGERGYGKSKKYRLSILNLTTGKPVMSEDYTTFKQIGETLNISPMVAYLIYQGKYQLGMGKQKHTKEYARYRIEKI